MDKRIIESTKRNYFIIGSVLTFFAVGGATLYAKTGGEIERVPQVLGFGDSTSSGLEQEIEIEHGVVTTTLKPHGGDRSDTQSSPSPAFSSSEGMEQEVEFEHGVLTITEKPHRSDEGDERDDDSHRGRGGDEGEDDEDDDFDDKSHGKYFITPLPPTPTVSTVPAPAPTVPTKTFSLAEIAAHNNNSSCYTTIGGAVYDVTTYIPVHKGGSAAILAICGKDGSSLFAGQHAGAPKPEQMLASFKIGTLAQ